MKEEIRTDNTEVIANACKKITELENQLTKAKEIIREFLNYNANSDWLVISKKAEAFINKE